MGDGSCFSQHWAAVSSLGGVPLFGKAIRAAGLDHPATAVLAGGGAIVSGMFRTDISATSELVHSSASALATLALVILCLAYWIPTLRRAVVRPDSVGTALAVIATILSAISPLLDETRWTDLSQRLLWFALLAWPLRTTWHRG